MKDNGTGTYAPGRHPNSLRNLRAPEPKLTPEQVSECVRRYAASESSYQLAAAFGVNAATVRDALRREGVTLRPRGGGSRGCRTVPSPQDVASACAFYLEGGSLADTWRTFHVTADDLRAAGVAIRGRGRPVLFSPGSEDEARVLARLASGESAERIAASEFVHPSTIDRVQRRASSSGSREAA